jgi:hypothetical protein
VRRNTRRLGHLPPLGDFARMNVANASGDAIDTGVSADREAQSTFAPDA